MHWVLQLFQIMLTIGIVSSIVVFKQLLKYILLNLISILITSKQALLIEKGIYPIKRIELMDCDILYYSVERLARTFKVSNLTEVNLDYNEFGDEGCERLCAGCKNNKVSHIYP